MIIEVWQIAIFQEQWPVQPARMVADKTSLISY